MEQRLKERLIGAAILVALAVWLVPWILDGRAPPPEKQAASVPLELPAPQRNAPQRTQRIDLDVPQDASPVVAGNDTAAAGPPAAGEDSGAASAGESRSTSSPTKASPQPGGSAAAPEPHSASGGKPQASKSAEPRESKSGTAPPAAASSDGPKWMVQLGSFGEQDNAERLAQRVSGVGFDAKISTHKSDGQVLYRVRVGPKDTRNAAEATATALSAHGFVAQVVTDD
jgi:DedD protein